MLKYKLWLVTFVVVQFIGRSVQRSNPLAPHSANTSWIQINLPSNTLVCNSTYTRIWFNESMFMTHQPNNSLPGLFFLARKDSETTANGTMCQGVRNGNEVSITLHENRVACAYNVHSDSTTVVLSYLVRFPYQASNVTISRSLKYEFELKCYYPAALHAYLGPLNPIHKEHHIVDPNVRKGNFNVTLSKRYSNTTIAAGHVDTVPYPVYVSGKIYTSANDSNFILQATSCYATPTANRDDSTRMVFISNSCPVNDSSAGGHTVVMVNYASIYVIFKFKLFYWGNIGPVKSKIYIHCCFKVCNKLVSENCTSAYANLCNATAPTSDTMYGRRKRSLTMDKEDEIHASYGPIEVKGENEHFDLNRKDKNPEEIVVDPEIKHPNFILRETEPNLVCDKTKLGCSYDCALTMSNEITCVCPRGFGLAKNSKTCVFQKTKTKPGRNIEVYDKDPYFVPVSAALVSLFCYIVITARNLSSTGK